MTGDATPAAWASGGKLAPGLGARRTGTGPMEGQGNGHFFGRKVMGSTALPFFSTVKAS